MEIVIATGLGAVVCVSGLFFVRFINKVFRREE